MKMGVVYNVFDGHELLEKSIESIRSSAATVVVVWQRVSNFGDKCNPFLEAFLNDLVKRKLVDVLLEFRPPAHYDSAAKLAMVSRVAEGLDGPAETIGTQFFHELSKRELGRVACVQAECSHFLLMDCDEFYLEDELRSAMRAIEKRGYDTTACRMRLFLKEPIYEYFPYDNCQVVPFICKCAPNSKLSLAAPFASMMADPTRRPEPLGNFFFFERGLVEMYHYSFVRLDMRKKFASVSNRGNYTLTDEFLKKFDSYDMATHGAIHPHPVIGQLFSQVRIAPNYFGINLSLLCPRCVFQKSRCHCERTK